MTHQPLILSVRGKTPKVGEGTYLAPNSTLVGDVTMGKNCSVWFNAIVRGDVMPVKIGDETNIQDASVVHGTFNKAATTIGSRVSIGHNVTLHGCTIGDKCLIGMGTTIMDGVELESQVFVGAGSLLTEGKKFPSKTLVMGRPAKVVRPLTEDEIKFFDTSANNYLLYKTWYEDGGKSGS